MFTFGNENKLLIFAKIITMSTPQVFFIKRLRGMLFSEGITVDEVAKKANVSRQTASKVLNGVYVNQTVIKAAEDLLSGR